MGMFCRTSTESKPLSEPGYWNREKIVVRFARSIQIDGLIYKFELSAVMTF